MGTRPEADRNLGALWWTWSAGRNQSAFSVVAAAKRRVAEHGCFSGKKGEVREEEWQRVTSGGRRGRISGHNDREYAGMNRKDKLPQEQNIRHVGVVDWLPTITVTAQGRPGSRNGSKMGGHGDDTGNMG